MHGVQDAVGQAIGNQMGQALSSPSKSSPASPSNMGANHNTSEFVIQEVGDDVSGLGKDNNSSFNEGREDKQTVMNRLS